MSATITPDTSLMAVEQRPVFRSLDVYLALAGAVVLLVAAVVGASRSQNTEKTDFSVTYIGAYILHTGNAAHLYDLDEQVRLRKTLYTRAEPLIFEHPPFEALLLSPLAALPYRSAYLAWGLMNVVVLLVLPYLLRPYAPVPQDTLGYLALFFLFAPLGVALYQGQSSLFLLLLYSLCFICMKRGDDVMAGVFLGLGLFKFQFVLPFALIFLLRRKGRFLAGFSASAAALGGLSLTAVGYRGILSYVQLLMKIATHPENATYGSAKGMATVQGFVHAVLRHTVPGRVQTAIVGAASLALVAGVAHLWNRAAGKDPAAAFDLYFSAAVVVSLMTGFHMFAHDLSPLLLALLLVTAHFPAPGRMPLRVALGTTLGIFWAPPVHFLLLAGHCAYLLFPVLLIFTVATLKLAGNSLNGTRIANQGLVTA
jgi:hypothetical protein